VSLDVIVQDIPAEAASPREIPDDFQPQGLGLTGTDVLNAARAVGGSLDVSDPTWVHWTGPGYEIELSLDDPNRSFALHCRGDADACRAAAAALVDRLGVRAFVVWDGTIIG
jgi:hypothetical protein